MSIPILSLIQRCRRHLPRLLSPEECPPSILPEREEALGLYKNESAEDVAFTTTGLREGNHPLISYAEIKATRVVEEDEPASQLELSLKGGKLKKLTFDGGNGRFRDIWEITRLLDRILATTDPQNEQEREQESTPKDGKSSSDTSAKES